MWFDYLIESKWPKLFFIIIKGPFNAVIMQLPRQENPSKRPKWL